MNPGQSSRRRGTIIAALLTLALAAPLIAQFNRTALLIDAPTADALIPGAVRLTAAGSQRTVSNTVNPGVEGDLNFRAGITKGLELALSAYTRADYVLNASYQLINGEGKRPSFALGIHEIGINSSVSSVGHGDNVWPDERYPGKPNEAFSAYAVTSIPIGSAVRLHAGIGRGRYVGYGDFTKYLNSDIFLSQPHQWAVGAFGGAEVKLGRHTSLMAEVDGRDLNAGIKAGFGPLSVALAATKLEGLASIEKFQRVSLAVSYQADNLLRKRTPGLKPATQSPVFGTLNGKIIDLKTGLPLADCAIQVSTPGQASSATEPAVATDKDGAFQFTNRAPGKALLSAGKSGYVRQTVATEIKASGSTYLEVALQPEVSELPMPPLPIAFVPDAQQAAPGNQPSAPGLKLIAMKFAPVYFAFDQSDINPEAAGVLRDHARTLISNPDLRVTVRGFTDEVGSDEYNLKLGELRARSVLEFLRTQGIPANRLKWQSMGRLISSSGLSHSLNRRCELIVVDGNSLPQE